MRRLVVSSGLGLFLATLSSCGPPPRFQTGYATYFVDFYDPIVDWTGRPTQAYCADYLTFVGDIDTACPPYPMVWSYAQYQYMQCSYRDAYGVARYYVDYFYFWPGYIAERSCDGQPSQRPPVAIPFRNAETKLTRDADGRLVLDEPIALDPNAPVDAADLRSLLVEHVGPLPTSLPGTVGNTVRVGPARDADGTTAGTFE